MAPRRQGKPRGSRLDAHEAVIVGMIEADKDITLNKVDGLKAGSIVNIGRSALCAWLRGRGLTSKNRPWIGAGAAG